MLLPYRPPSLILVLLFFNVPAPTKIYTLSLHDALPIYQHRDVDLARPLLRIGDQFGERVDRSEEHTSELQSRPQLVCRLLLEKKNKVSLYCNYNSVV